MSDATHRRKLYFDVVAEGHRYPITLYHPSGIYRVTFGPEEHARLEGRGFGIEREEGTKYVVWTAMQPAPPNCGAAAQLAPLPSVNAELAPEIVAPVERRPVGVEDAM